MQRLRLAGVPEHFNLPWRLAVESGALSEIGVEAEWIDIPEGTGAIMAGLAEESIDIATPLTEGAIVAIARGHTAKLVRTWVDSPLLWGIFVAGDSTYFDVSELQGLRFAISRWGSGSELMARVLAHSLGWRLTDDQHFVVVNNLDGALEALPARQAEIFLWNKSMTKPHVDAGTLRLVSEFPTPWPSFCIATNARVDPDLARRVADVISTIAAALTADPTTPRLVVERYGLKLAGAAEWFEDVRWNTAGAELDPSIVQQVLDELFAVGRLDEPVTAHEVLTSNPPESVNPAPQ